MASAVARTSIAVSNSQKSRAVLFTVGFSRGRERGWRNSDAQVASIPRTLFDISRLGRRLASYWSMISRTSAIRSMGSALLRLVRRVGAGSRFPCDIFVRSPNGNQSGKPRCVSALARGRVVKSIDKTRAKKGATKIPAGEAATRTLGGNEQRLRRRGGLPNPDRSLREL